MVVSELSVMELPILQQAQLQTANMHVCRVLTVCTVEQNQLLHMYSNLQ